MIFRYTTLFSCTEIENKSDGIQRNERNSVWFPVYAVVNTAHFEYIVNVQIMHRKGGTQNIQISISMKNNVNINSSDSNNICVHSSSVYWLPANRCMCMCSCSFSCLWVWVWKGSKILTRTVSCAQQKFNSVEIVLSYLLRSFACMCVCEFVVLSIRINSKWLVTNQYSVQCMYDAKLCPAFCM